MRFIRGLVVALLLPGSPSWAVPDEPIPEPSAKEEVPDWKREAEDLEARAAKAEEKQDLATALELRQAAVKVLREKHPESPEMASALSQAASTLCPLSREAEALPLYKESLAMRRQLFKGDHADVAMSLSYVAWTLESLGRAAEALPPHEESLAIRRRLFRGDHPEVAASLNNLALTLRSLGRAAEALPMLEESLAMCRRIFNGDHVYVAGGLGNLALTLSSLGRAAEALPLHEESLAMLRRLFRGDHAKVAESLGNLANTLRVLGRAAEALPLLDESLAMRRRLFKGDHRAVATSLDNLASVLKSLGRVAEALPLHEESLAMMRRLFKGDHPAVATGLNNLALTLQMLGRAAEALPLLDESLAIWRRLSPGDHPAVATSLDNLASVLKSLGRVAEALPLHEESLAMMRRLFKGDHPAVATGLNNLARTLQMLGRAAEALPLLDESLAMRRRLFRGDHPEVAQSLNNLAMTLLMLGRAAEALPLADESLAIWRRLFQGDHPEVATSLDNLASVLESLGRVAEALPLHEESLAMMRRLFQGDHPEAARGINNLAVTLESLGRSAEALPLKEESLAMWRRHFQGDHPDVAWGLNNLASTLESLGRASEALPRREEAYAITMRLSSPDRWRWGTALGIVHLRAGRAGDAVEPLRNAVETLETIRLDARGLLSEERSRFVESMRDRWDPYEALTRAHVALKETGLALGVLERGRGREMLDLLLRGQSDRIAEARAAASANGDRRALDEIDRVESDRASAEAEVVRREKETEKARARPDASREEVRGLVEAESKARKSLLDVMSRAHRLVRDTLPAANPLGPKEVQGLLTADERLLAYSVAGETSFAFVVSHQLVDVVELPTKRLVEAAEAYSAVLSNSRSSLAEAAIAGRALFHAAVPESVWKSVSSASRLYLMADGVLNRIPFETLVVEEKEGKPVYWEGAGPPIAYEPSASVLAWLRGRPRAESFGADLVAVGDPLFAGNASPVVWPEKGVLVTEIRPGGQAERLGLRPGDVLVRYDGKEVADPAGLRESVQTAGEGRSDIAVDFLRGGEKCEVRAASGPLGVTIALEPPPVAGPSLLSGGQMAIALRSALERGRSLAALPGTRTEVAGIEKALRERLGERAKATVLLGGEATEARLFEATKSPRFLHIATHGLVDETETASFSGLALSVPAVPVAGDDGFLTLVDLFSRWRGRLEGTELVVLSACESTKGREQKGESMYALPWGFLYAGARAVVGSLWKVDDEATAYLMAEFYRRLLEGDGKDPLAALSAARHATRGKFPHPNRWGAFVLSGAPR